MNAHDEIIIYGLYEGTKDTLIHIDKAENGRECKCVCPHCGAPLVARNGGKGGRYRQNIHHFAHDKGYEPCGQGRMSALHIMAQKILEEEKQVMLPAYSREYVQHASTLQSFESITLEKVCKDEVSRRRPDCIGEPFNNNSLWIEIFCCNPITMERAQDIIRRKQYCIEIDFSNLLNTDYTPDIVRDRLRTNGDDRRWICHPEWDEEEKRKEEEAKRRQEEARQKLMEETRFREEEQRKAIAEALQKGSIKMVQEPQTETPAPQVTWHISEHKEIYSSAIPETPNSRDWVMYAKTIYGNNDAVDSFYKLLHTEYTKVTLNNSHRFVADEVYTKSNELLPRISIIAEVNKTYLILLLSIWVLDRLNQNEAFALGKLFVENRIIRNDIFKIVKQVGSINKRQIEDTLVPIGIESREDVLKILRICYMK